MAYYKVRIEVWCDWNPAESNLEEIAENISAGEAICTKREVVAIVNRPQDIEATAQWVAPNWGFPVCEPALGEQPVSP
jgi:hypothetical protein